MFMDRDLVKCVDKDQNTALIWAVKRNQYEVAKLLVQKGACVFKRNLL